MVAIACYLGNYYENQDDYQEALKWYEKALVIQEKVLGKDHPDTAETYNNIAFVYDRGRLSRSAGVV
jgi:tetratricopeptide (TPR) repeat protein